MLKQTMSFIQAIISGFNKYLPTWILLLGVLTVIGSVWLLFNFKWAMMCAGIWLIVTAILINQSN